MENEKYFLDCGHISNFEGFQIADYRRNGVVYEICEEQCSNIEGISHNDACIPQFMNPKYQLRALDFGAVEYNNVLWNRTT
jgi:hypothetical protein